MSDVDFPTPFNFHDFEPVTLVELRMRFYSCKIRAKPFWWEKVHDPAIVAKWRAEIVEHDRETVERLWGRQKRSTVHRDDTEDDDEEDDDDVDDDDDPQGDVKKWPHDPVTEAQLDYVVEELKHAATKRDNETGAFPAAIHAVYEAHSLVSQALKSELIAAVSILENVPKEEKDWHPGSHKQVLDLVHPSLYCLRIGETLVRKEDASSGDALEVITNENYQDRRFDLEGYSQSYYALSTKYQWLPTDFTVSESGTVAATSYINNLHPTRHRALYPPITSVLARFVPLFERVLGDSLSPKSPFAILVDPCSWYQDPEVPEPKWRPNIPSDEYDRLQSEWENKHYWPTIPDPAPFDPEKVPDLPPLELKGHTLQVIVKLANIVLTPKKPKYGGGSWHVEGMENERIVATGLYYYACANITESRLAFRTVVGNGEKDGLSYEGSDFKGYRAAFGFSDNDPMNQHLGHIVAEEGKCVAFPNFYQHRVDAFELADPSKPGHRKILCFFLVDPTQRILSTSDVPPQQADWTMDEVAKVPAMRKLPVELFDMIIAYAKDGLISRKEAEEHRTRLMKERSKSVVALNEAVYEVKFNMCEH